MHMTKYESPSIETIKFELADVITTSGEIIDETTGEVIQPDWT